MKINNLKLKNCASLVIDKSSIIMASFIDLFFWLIPKEPKRQGCACLAKRQPAPFFPVLPALATYKRRDPSRSLLVLYLLGDCSKRLLKLCFLDYAWGSLVGSSIGYPLHCLDSRLPFLTLASQGRRAPSLAFTMLIDE